MVEKISEKILHERLFSGSIISVESAQISPTVSANNRKRSKIGQIIWHRNDCVISAEQISTVRDYSETSMTFINYILLD